LPNLGNLVSGIVMFLFQARDFALPILQYLIKVGYLLIENSLGDLASPTFGYDKTYLAFLLLARKNTSVYNT